jgi:hypothetical protein
MESKMKSKTNPNNVDHIRKLRELILEKDKAISALLKLVEELSVEISEIKKQIPDLSD